MNIDNHSKDSSNNNKVLAGLLFLLSAGVLLFAFDSGQVDGSAEVGSGIPKEQLDPAYVDKARKHLKMTADQVQFDGFKNQQEVLNSSPSLSKTHEQRAYNPHEGLDLSAEDTAKRIAEDIGRHNDQNSGVPETPDQLIQAQIFDQNQLDDYSRAYKEEYARQFVENARRGGYEVELSEDYRVISVKRIRTPASGPSIYRNNNNNHRGPVR